MGFLHVAWDVSGLGFENEFRQRQDLQRFYMHVYFLENTYELRKRNWVKGDQNPEQNQVNSLPIQAMELWSA